ncbi:helix-turn-helix domain-containing protein [Armatimonas sp.]|uniref:helix-turn-helix domain-containing protein n=1 Tax=Armatimonas sp. TaxID=1872638 RepID=UPI00374DDAF8
MESAILKKNPPIEVPHPGSDTTLDLEGDGKSIVWKSLHKILTARSIRRRRFADKLGVHYGTLCHWLYGSRFPIRENVQKVAELLAGGDREAAQGIFAELANDAPIRLEWDVPEAEERARKLFFL